MRGAWTAGAALPGGNFAWNAAPEVQDELRRRYAFLREATARRLVRAYGTLATEMLGDARDDGDLGCCLGADLSEREVDWLARTEWARTADDVLWRRSKLGLRFSTAEAAALDSWTVMAGRDPAISSPTRGATDGRVKPSHDGR